RAHVAERVGDPDGVAELRLKCCAHTRFLVQVLARHHDGQLAVGEMELLPGDAMLVEHGHHLEREPFRRAESEHQYVLLARDADDHAGHPRREAAYHGAVSRRISTWK